MGISGANIAVAETGTIIICTNEGNARLTTTVPPVHIAVLGYEKLVPRMMDVVPILEALPRSGTANLLPATSR
ncbi:LUD domain-containing protein [Moorellaceae bacterium AZ2]